MNSFGPPMHHGPPHNNYGAPPPPPPRHGGGFGHDDDMRGGPGPHDMPPLNGGPMPMNRNMHHGGPMMHHEPYFGGGPYGNGPPNGPPPGDYNMRNRGGGNRGRRDDGPPGVSLLVRNISPDIRQEDLQHAFGKIGEVRDVYIPRDFHSQQPKGFAFVEFATNEQAREARNEMDNFTMKGRVLEVVFAQERRKTPNEMRGRVVDCDDDEPAVRMGNMSGGRGGAAGGNFNRSSSFERMKMRQRERISR